MIHNRVKHKMPTYVSVEPLAGKAGGGIHGQADEGGHQATNTDVCDANLHWCELPPPDPESAQDHHVENTARGG